MQSLHSRRKRLETSGRSACHSGITRKVGPSDTQAALTAILLEPTGSEFQIAETYAYLGDAGQTYRRLEAAVASQDPGILRLRGDPLLKGLIGDLAVRSALGHAEPAAVTFCDMDLERSRDRKSRDLCA